MANNLFQQQGTNIFSQPSSMVPFQAYQPNKIGTPIQPRQSIGSYRGMFKPMKLDYVPQDSSSIGIAYSTNLICQPEYKGLSQLMVRLEDYYLIRSKQIDAGHQQQIQKAVQMGQFDARLIQNSSNVAQPVFPNNMNKSGWNNPTTTPNIFQNNSNMYQSNKPMGNSGTPINFQQQPIQPNQYGTTPNLFQQPYQTQQQQAPWQNPIGGTSNNLFQNNNPQNNILQQKPITPNIYQTQQPQGQNIFQQQQPQQPYNNIFQQQSQQQMPFQQYQQPNLFTNQMMPNNTMPNNNIFSNNQQQYPYGMQNNNMFSNNNMIPNNNNYFQQRMVQPNMMMSTNGYYQQQYGYQQPLQPSIQHVEQFLNYASVLAQEYRNYMDQQEKEQQLQDVQEQVIREKEYYQQIQRVERDRKYHSRLAKKANTSRSPSPFVSRTWTTNLSNSNLSINKSRITSPHRSRMDISTVRDVISIQVIYGESNKQEANKRQVNISHGYTYGQLKQELINQLSSEYIIRSNVDAYIQFSRIYLNGQEMNDKAVLNYNHSHSLLVAQTDSPILSIIGYESVPALSRLQNYEKVEQFTIQNKHGRVRWVDCNIRYINFNSLIRISEGEIDMYDEDAMDPLLKPDVGQKLNKECDVTLKLTNWINKHLINGLTYDFESIETELKKRALHNQVQFIGLDQNQMEYTFRVQHFTKYTFTVDFDLTDDSNQEQSQTESQLEYQQQQFDDQPNFNNTQQQYEQIIDNQQTKPHNKLKDNINNYLQSMLDDAQYNEQRILEQQQNHYNLIDTNNTVQQVIEKVAKLNNITYGISNSEDILKIQENRQYLSNYNAQIGNASDILEYYYSIACKQPVNSRNMLSCIYLQVMKQQIGCEEQQLLQLFNLLFGNYKIDINSLSEYSKNNRNIPISNKVLLEMPVDDKLIGYAFCLWVETVYANTQSMESMKRQDYRESLLNCRQYNSTQRVLMSTHLSDISTPHHLNTNWITVIMNWRLCNKQPKLYSSEWYQSIASQLIPIKIQSVEQAAFQYYLYSQHHCGELTPILQYLSSAQQLYPNHTLYLLLHNIILNMTPQNCKQLQVFVINQLTILMNQRVHPNIIHSVLITLGQSGLFDNKQIANISKIIAINNGGNQTFDKLEQVNYLLYSKQYEDAANLAYDNKLFDYYVEIVMDYVIPICIIEPKQQGKLQDILHTLNNVDPYLILPYKIIQECAQQFLEESKQIISKQQLLDIQPKNAYQYHMKNKIYMLL